MYDEAASQLKQKKILKMGRPYQPSNGTEGMAFVEEYCMNCIHCDPDPNGAKQCDILCRSLVYTANEPGYPSEWVYNEDNQPCCTSWKKWDWGNDGDPDDPENPKAPIPEDPNQLCLPFIFDEIGIGETCSIITASHDAEVNAIIVE